MNTTNKGESQTFVNALEKIFSTTPYSTDPRKEMMFSHLQNGRDASKKRIKDVLPFIDKPITEINVLDAGCGSGMASGALSDLGFRTIIGFDLGDEPIGLPLAPLRHYADGATVSFMKANGYAVPLADGCMDFCWCGFVIEHVPDAKSFLTEIFRVLSPGGILYISTNNRLWPIEPHSNTWFASWLPTSMAEKYARWRKHWPEHVPWDVYLPTYWEMNRWANDIGFEILASTYELVGSEGATLLERVRFLKKLQFLLPNLYLLLKKPE